jgi:hypothetical protein
LGDRIFYDDDKHSAFAEWSASLLSYAVLMDFTDDSLAPIWLLVADQNNHRIRRVTLGGEVSTFAGTGTAGNQDDLVTGAANSARGRPARPSARGGRKSTRT